MYNVQEDYEEVVKSYYKSIYRVMYGFCGNSFDAEDAVQFAYLKLLQGKKRFASKEHVKNWLYKVAMNYAKNLKKNLWNQREELVQDIPFKYDKDIELYEVILELKDNYREVVLLYYYEEYSVREISQILSVKESTIQTRLQRAREQLKKRLEDWNNGASKSRQFKQETNESLFGPNTCS